MKILEQLQSHQFEQLFLEDLGWDRLKSANMRDSSTAGTRLIPIAHKRGFAIFACEVHRTDLANRGLLRRHQRELRKLYHEHILIHYCETPRKLKPIGEHLGITRERVRQIQKRAEEKLASCLRAGGLEPLPPRNEDTHEDTQQPAEATK